MYGVSLLISFSIVTGNPNLLTSSFIPSLAASCPRPVSNGFDLPYYT